jgi:diguanylate cyclase (GGDEF)-like protein
VNLLSMPRRWSVAIEIGSYGLLLLATLADWRFGDDVLFTLFYLPGIAAAAWFGGRRRGTAASVAAACLWLVSDLAARHAHSHPAVSYWNAAVGLGFFLAVALLASALRRALEAETRLSRTDPLTGAANRRAFLEAAEAEIRRASRYGRPFTVVCFDLDNFKAVNDTAGHEAGDRLLQSVVGALRKSLRATDIVARLGGDEFAVLLPEMGPEPAPGVAAKIREAVAGVAREARLAVSASVGAVTFAVPPASTNEMLRRADRLMYAVKNAGKDGVRHEVASGEPAAAPGPDSRGGAP